MSTRAIEQASEPRRTVDGDCRSLYAKVCDPEGWFVGDRAVDEIRAELRRISAPGPGPQDLGELRARVVSWSAAERRRYQTLADGGDKDVLDLLVRRAVLACAPLAVQAGAWLQWMSSPGNADDPVVLRILVTYAADVGVGHPRTSLGNAYVALMREAHLAEYAVPAARLAHDWRINDRNFYLPALLLAMGRRPEDFRPEILGADLCLRIVGLPPVLPVAIAALPVVVAGGADDRDAVHRTNALEPTNVDHAWDTVLTYLDAERPERKAERLDRVMLGFTWALGALVRWSDDLHAELRAARDPAYGMAELLRSRARQGAVYHGRYLLGGRPLSEWLRECGEDPTGLLAALAASELVRPGRAESSALVNGLVQQRGPMFRIFTYHDLELIRRWINSLPADQSPEHGAAVSPHPSPRAMSYPLPPLFIPPREPPSVADTALPADLRSAYHLLQYRPGPVVLRHYTYMYVCGWLARSRHRIGRAALGLPEQWPPHGLRPWLLDQHDRHNDDFQDSRDAAIPSREALIDSTVQLAPLTLIDGAWLQGFTDYEQASSEHGSFLFGTYWDELGNGVPELNHPRIYREVLADMEVDLPPTSSEEFARWPGFKDSSFELPVYWLSIGRYPRTFLPEVLGLNLAMELSGVGGGYRRAHIALRKYGFSSRFVDIHNTIDNVATGHSAWAADAVDAYMAAIPISQGAGARATAWERVVTGFRSLNPPTGFWARRAGHVRRKDLYGRAPSSQRGTA